MKARIPLLAFALIAATTVIALTLTTLNTHTSDPAHTDTAPPTDAEFKVVTSFTIIADMTRTIAGDAATVVSITKPGAEIHDYQPTPKDIIRTHNADLILWNGMNLERWFEKFLSHTPNTPSAIVTTDITPLPITHGSYEGKPNPHAWMSLDNAQIYIRNITRALITHDPDNSETYTRNAAAYSARIKAMHTTLTTALKNIPNSKRYLVTSEGAFSYLAHDLNMKEVYLWPINAEQQGTPDQVRTVIDTIRTHAIPVIFSESTVSAKPAQQIAQETGIHYGGALYVDSLSTTDGPVPTYLDLLTVTTQTIANGFSHALSTHP